MLNSRCSSRVGGVSAAFKGLELLDARLMLAASEILILDRVYATAIDQPQLSAVMYDGSGVITDLDGNPVLFEPYIDTGASGFVISHLTAYGFETIDMLGEPTVIAGLDLLAHATVIGQYSDIGVGGPELGDVTSPLGIRLLNGTPLEATFDLDTFETIPPVVNLAEFGDSGSFNLWVRRQEGYGERQQFMGIDLVIQPMDVVGMPVISQSVMLMDPTTIGFDEEAMTASRMSTYLLPKGAAVPPTNLTFNLRLNDFTGSASAGETLPSHSANPVFDHVSLANTVDGVTYTSSDNTWLFDTGSAASIISFAHAKALGLIGPAYETFDDFMADWSGLSMPVAGIGSIDSALSLPIMELGEIRIPDADGHEVVWRNVDVLVADVAGLDGVLGLNMLLPATTLDLANLTELGQNDGHFDKIVFETIDAQHAQLRLAYDGLVPPPVVDESPPDDVDPVIVTLDARGRAQFRDADNDLVTVQLKGGGSGTLTFAAQGPADMQSISLSGTISRSSLTITTAGRGTTTSVGTIDVDGPLRTLKATTTQLGGLLSIGAGPAKASVKIALGAGLDGAIDSQMPIRSLTAGSWTSSDDQIETVAAPSLTTLKIRGDFQADLDLSGSAAKLALGSAKIGGDLTGSLWQIAGNVGKIAIAREVRDSAVRSTGSIAGVTVGACFSSDFLAGIAQGVERFPVQQTAGQQDFANPLAAIGSFRVKGWRGLARTQTLFADSNISAARIGSVGLLNGDLATGDSGVHVLGSELAPPIRKLTCTDLADKANSWKWRWSSTTLYQDPEGLLNVI